MRRVPPSGTANGTAYHDGDPLDGSIPPAAFFNVHNEELAGLVESAGLVLSQDDSDERQVTKAVQLLQRPTGQCRLKFVSAAQIVLVPYNGNKLTIGGLAQTIPAAGVTLAAAGLNANTLYYVYAYMAAGVMTLEAVPTGHATDATTGVEIKAGDNSRSLVGMVYVVAGPAFASSLVQRLVLSYFNRHDLAILQILSGSTSSTSGYAAIGAQISYLCWADDPVTIGAQVVASNSVAQNTNNCALTLDSTTTIWGNFTTAQLNSFANAWFVNPVLSAPTFLAEGYHYNYFAAYLSGGTFTLGSTSSIFGSVKG